MKTLDCIIHFPCKHVIYIILVLYMNSQCISWCKQLMRKVDYLLFCSIFLTLDFKTAKELSNLLRKSFPEASLVSTEFEVDFVSVFIEFSLSLPFTWLLDREVFPELLDRDLSVLSISMISQSFGRSCSFSQAIGIKRYSLKNKLSFVHSWFSLLICSTCS